MRQNNIAKYETQIIRALSSEDKAFLTPAVNDLLKPAVKAIQAGELVAFPTETVYGLGADAFNSEAVAKIYKAKGRPQDNPLIVHLADLQDLEKIALEIPDKAVKLYRKFSPGPLSIILKARPELPEIVTAGLPTVAVRFPAHPLAIKLIRMSTTPLVAPSANISGKPSPTLAEHVYADMQGKIPYIIDGGSSRIGVESTVLDLTGAEPCILRPGGISAEAISALIGEKVTYSEDFSSREAEQPKAPGMKYRHYAPKAEVELWQAKLNNCAIDFMPNQHNKIAFYINNVEAKRINEICLSQGKKTYIVAEQDFLSEKLIDELRAVSNAVYIFAYGEDSKDAARYLFAAFRWLDDLGTEKIYAEDLSRDSSAKAYMNRLLKAAKGN